MRCSSCGTENTPDSRFCGGCGARTAPSTVAPTQKISDDAPMPAPAAAAHGAYPQPYTGSRTGPAELPPPSIPPTNNSIPPQSRPYSGPQPVQQYNSVPPQPSPAYNSVPPQPSPAYHSVPPQPSPAYNSVPPQPSPAIGSQPPRQRSGSQPVSEPPGSIAPATVQRRASAPPVASRASSPTPSISLPHKAGGTRWGVVIVILAVDLGLAAAGAWMLQAGL